ncbi:MAG: hypothetical protein ABFS34_10580 [Gemmatimonadota bacterium]
MTDSRGALGVLSIVALAGAIACAPADDAAVAAAEPAAETASAPIALAFMTHLDANMPEQDVFIEREAGSGEVWRVTAGDNDMSAPVYRTAEYVPHDPFNDAAVGPYAMGEPLGFTVGDWLAHSGSGTYECVGGVGHVDMSFTGLVPNGVYTIWHAFMASPPTDPFVQPLELPLGARDGSESVFTADEDGTATVVRDVEPCLEMSDLHTAAVLAINYHSDGLTYGPMPGEFGNRAHIPLFLMLPSREGIE